MFILFVILISVALTNSQSCSINCQLSGNFQNPNNRNSYIQCSNGRAALVLCPFSGDGFNRLEFDGQKCVEKYDCPQPNGMFQHKRKDMYWRCSNGVASIERCQAGQEFTGYAGCTQPFRCPELSGNFPNPSNKSEYYQCCFGEPTLNYCPNGYQYEDGSDDRLACVPVFKCPQSFGKYRNIRKENQYYNCVNGEPQLLTCPHKQIFDGLECIEKFECPLPDGKFINRQDKSNRTYFNCNNNIAIKERCPGSLVFYGHECAEPFKCPSLDGRFRHPADRNKYYKCENGWPYPHQCPQGLEFSELKQDCQKPFECPRMSGRFPHPENRTLFYQCLNYVPELRHCPIGRYFDGTKCTVENPVMGPKCPGYVTMIKHPTNPRKYYYCGTDHIPREQECSSGFVFDETLRTCVRSLFNCPEPNGQFPHPYDQTLFFSCREGVAQLTSCPSDQKFDKNTGICSGSQSLPLFRCPALDGMFSHNTNRSLFYYCRGGVPELRFCGINKIFDSRVQNCVEKPISDTNIGFRCPVSDGIFADSYYRNRYYVCRNYIPYIRECRSDERFDENQLKCVDISSQYPFQCQEPNGYFPYTYDNKYYYLCREGTAQLIRCPNGQIFNDQTMHCVFSMDFKCPKPDGLFRHGTNQSRFYYCRNNVPELRECQAQSIFDEPTGRCIPWSWPNTFYCPLPNGLFINPQNNSQYYECCQGRPALKSCPNNQIFNGRHCISEIIYSCNGEGNKYPAHPPHCYNGHRYQYTCPYQYGSELIYNGYRCVEPYHCPTSQGNHIIKNPVHVHQYYRCVDGMPSLYTCSKGFAYDERRGCCVYDERQINGYYGYVVDNGRQPKPNDMIESDRGRVDDNRVIPGVVVQEDRGTQTDPIVADVVHTQKIPIPPPIEPIEVRHEEQTTDAKPTEPTKPVVNGSDNKQNGDEEDDRTDDDTDGDEDYKGHEDDEEEQADNDNDDQDYKEDTKYRRSFNDWKFNKLI